MIKKIIIAALLALSVALNVILICTLSNPSGASTSNQQEYLQNYHSFSDNYDSISGKFTEHRVLLGCSTLLLDSDVTINFGNGPATLSEINSEKNLQNDTVTAATASDIKSTGAK